MSFQVIGPGKPFSAHGALDTLGLAIRIARSRGWHCDVGLDKKVYGVYICMCVWIYTSSLGSARPWVEILQQVVRAADCPITGTYLYRISKLWGEDVFAAVIFPRRSRNAASLFSWW
jgi:hypothetical protein